MRTRVAVLAVLLIAYPIVATGQASTVNVSILNVNVRALPDTHEAGSLGAKGWFIGAALNGSWLDVEGEDDDEAGRGLLLHGGFGFNRKLALILDVNVAQMEGDGEGWYLTHGDIGLRYHFAATRRRFVPFVEGAVTGWTGTQKDVDFEGQRGDLEISGTGFTLGAGFLYAFGSRWALNTGFKWTSGEFNEVKFGNVTVEGFDIDATSGRFNIGLTWFLGGGR